MNIVRMAKILALSLAMFTSPALADYSLGKIPDTWYQLSTDSERTFCGAGAQFFNGVYLHIAYIAEIGEWVIVFGSESWQFQNGSRYDVTVLIDGMGSTIEAKAINEHAVMFRASKEFLHAFTAGQKMSIHTASGGSVATPMMLNGTTKAVTAIVECNEALMAQQQQRQPFGAPKNYSQPRTPFTSSPSSRVFAGPERGA